MNAELEKIKSFLEINGYSIINGHHSKIDHYKIILSLKIVLIDNTLTNKENIFETYDEFVNYYYSDIKGSKVRIHPLQ